MSPKQSFMDSVAGKGVVNSSRIKPFDLNRLNRWNILLFKDPTLEGFPNNDPEIGIVYRTVFMGEENNERGALVVLPLRHLPERITPQPWHYFVNRSRRGEKMDMGLNPNQNYVLGLYASASRKGDPKDTIRVIPITSETLGLDNRNRFNSIGFCHQSIRLEIEDRLRKLFDDNPAIERQILHDAQRVYANKDNLENLAPKERQERGGFEVVTKRKRVFRPKPPGDDS